MRRIGPRVQAGLGIALLVVLALPWTRHAMEASMWRHMIVQFPLWMLAGALVAAAIGPRARQVIDGWNANGVSGLFIAGVILAVLMVPRVLDLALYQPQVEFAKLVALWLTGAALCLSWRRAGLVLQFFFLGNVLSMMAIVGMLYVSSPLRLCNAYLLGDQTRLGEWLTATAAVLGVAWLVWAGRVLMQREEEFLAQTAARHDASPRSDGESSASLATGKT